MRALVFGSRGQLAVALSETVPDSIEAIFLSSVDCDITQPATVAELVNQHNPDVLINAAAYTAVDLAETESDRAAAVNVDGARNLAVAAQQKNIRLIHVSTDFVFDGSADEPIPTDAQTNPLSVYGSTKRDGEKAALQNNPGKTVVVRTAWVYSKTGKNFVKTMLKLMAERDELGVVSDQIGSPTWADGLARVLWAFASQSSVHGLFHWTDLGETSWHDFAEAIQRTGLELGLLNTAIPIHPIPTDQYPTPATRPRYSVLDCSTTTAAVGVVQSSWTENLKRMMQEL